MPAQTKQIYEFGPFRLDTVERVLQRDGSPVPLSPKAFDVLLMLVESSGQLVRVQVLDDIHHKDGVEVPVLELQRLHVHPLHMTTSTQLRSSSPSRACWAMSTAACA